MLALHCYSLVQAMVLPFILPLLAFHPRLRGSLEQRLGRWRYSSGERPIWLHGSSAGDVLSLVPLARGFLDAGYPVVLSSWTRAGHLMAQRRLGEQVPVYRAPIDLASFVRAVVWRIRPRLLVLECLEIWPRMVSTCHQLAVPVAVVNGRLSERSLTLYRRARWLFEPCFSSLAMVTALTSEFADRFIRAGTSPERVFVESSSKHGRWQGWTAARSSVSKLVMGSLHAKEEDVLFPWIGRLRVEVPGLQVVVAPRYPHRARLVQQKLHGLGMDSRLTSAGNDPTEAIHVVDRMGELADQYRGAQIAFVGGSLVPQGGHNIVEPVAQGCPVIYGPYTGNCSEEARMLEVKGGGYRIADGRSFYDRAKQLLLDAAAFERSRKAGLEVATTLTSAADRILDRLFALCGESPRQCRP